MSSIKPRVLHNAVLLALGRGSGFRAGHSVAMSAVVVDVLSQTGFGGAEIRLYGAEVAKSGEDHYEAGLRSLRRKIHFAFRNQRGQSKGSKGTTYCKVPLTKLVRTSQWALTPFGVLVAKRLNETPFRVTPAVSPPVVVPSVQPSV